MKQLHNIMAPLILFCLMMVSGLPGFAQEQGEATSQVQDVITPKSYSDISATLTNGILPRGVKRTLLYHYLLLFIVIVQAGMCSFLLVSKRTEARMRGFR